MPLGSIYVPIIAVKNPEDPEKTLYYCMNIDIPDKLEAVSKDGITGACEDSRYLRIHSLLSKILSDKFKFPCAIMYTKV